MIVEKRGDRFHVSAPAKVNLHLEVLGQRDDGYHEVETLMVAISLYDQLDLCEQEAGTVVRCSDPAIREDENLVGRAIGLVREESGCSRGIEVKLTKRIPIGAGLGGGSSDAAATLWGLNRIWKLGWSKGQLARLGARLGSDVPFFLDGPAAVCRGRGEEVTPCPVGVPLHMVLVYPNELLSTASVYRQVRVPPRAVPLLPIQTALENGQISEVGQRLHNRLQGAAARLSRAVARLARHSRSWDCLGASMTGSGSAFFSLCSSTRRAQELADALRAADLGSVLVVTSCH